MPSPTTLAEMAKMPKCTGCGGTGTVVQSPESVIKVCCMMCLGTGKKVNA